MKKSQENFERITMRRLIQIQDGHPDVVKAWLAFLAKHQYYGVGMKANIWEYESLEAATSAGQEVKEGDYSGRREKAMLEKVNQILAGKGYREAMKGYELPKELQTLVTPKAPVVREKRAEKKTGEVDV
jgi:small subunit ribosomal protein S10